MRAVLIHSALHGLYLPINADASAETSFVRLCAPVLSRRARAESALSRSRARKSRGRAPLCAPDRVQRALEAPGEVTDGVRDRKQLRARARTSCVSGVGCAVLEEWTDSPRRDRRATSRSERRRGAQRPLSLRRSRWRRRTARGCRGRSRTCGCSGPARCSTARDGCVSPAVIVTEVVRDAPSSLLSRRGGRRC